MRVARYRALTHIGAKLIVFVIADVEMRVARYRALTHLRSDSVSELDSVVEMRVARYRALTHESFCGPQSLLPCRNESGPL